MLINFWYKYDDVLSNGTLNRISDMNFKMNFVLGLFCLGFLHQSVLCQDSKEILKVSVYYEALCPGCIRFITELLYPTYQKIGSSLSLEFVQVGDKKENNGKLEFTCQHGTLECVLNKLEACGVAAANNDQDKTVEFLHCIEGQDYYSDEKTRAEACASTLGVTAESLLECTKGPKGDELFSKSIDKMLHLQPPLSLVPTIVYNDKFDKDLLFDSLEDFLKTACKLFKVKPQGCS